MEEPGWREFEQLIARLEGALAPKGAIITSPDKIPDVITGNLREVDASIRMQVGTAPILITIECRQRTHRQDVTWIEQLATKKASIGAATTIAVSTSGFTEGAISMARRSGIELRRFEDHIEDELALRYAENISIQLVVTDWRVNAVGLEPQDGGPIPEEQIAPLLEDVKQDAQHAVIALENKTGKRLLLNSVVQSANTSDVVPGGPLVTKTVRIGFRPNTFSVETTEGLRYLKGLWIEVTFSRRELNVPLQKYHEYGGLENTVHQSLEGEVQISESEKLVITTSIIAPHIASKPLYQPGSDSTGNNT